MNWNKALNLLIIMFVIVNLMLGVANYKKHIQAYKISDEQVSMITTLLEDNGVTLACSLPESFKPVESVWLEPVEIETNLRDYLIKAFLNTDLSQVMITKDEVNTRQEHLVYKYEGKELRFLQHKVYYRDSNVSKEDSVVDEKQVLELADAFFNQLPMNESYKNVKIHHEIESYGAEVTYYEVYKGFPLFNSYVKMQVTPDGVYSAEANLINKNEKVEIVRALYPIHRVLFELMGNLDENVDITITNIELGYMIPNQGREHFLEEEAVPMYKIEFDGLNEPLFVNAYTNEMLVE